eukprot:2104105-Amphidinium_carterae.1
MPQVLDRGLAWHPKAMAHTQIWDKLPPQAGRGSTRCLMGLDPNNLRLHRCKDISGSPRRGLLPPNTKPQSQALWGRVLAVLAL